MKSVVVFIPGLGFIYPLLKLVIRMVGVHSSKSHRMRTPKPCIYHNVNGTGDSSTFNIDSDPGIPNPITFNKPGVVHLLCKVHPEMSAWVVVTENQYAAVTEHDGKFTIPNVPAGTYEISAWSEKLKPQGKTIVKVSEGKTAPVVLKMAI